VRGGRNEFSLFNPGRSGSEAADSVGWYLAAVAVDASQTTVAQSGNDLYRHAVQRYDELDAVNSLALKAPVIGDEQIGCDAGRRG
jgi:hypothetical protein